MIKTKVLEKTIYEGKTQQNMSQTFFEKSKKTLDSFVTDLQELKEKILNNSCATSVGVHEELGVQDR